MTDVGDLGRRVAERRRELHLSVETVAERAGMHPSYLDSLEHSSSVQPTLGSLWRLAAALDTTVDVLNGAGQLAPPGRTEHTARRVLGSLSPKECQELIADGGVGRIVYQEARGPVAVPVNFKMLGDDVVLLTDPDAAIGNALGQGVVSFEVDRIDEALGEGWSVLLTGSAHGITDPDERAAAAATGVRPWATDERRTLYVRISPTIVTGRRIRRG